MLFVDASVREQTDAEKELYRLLSDVTKKPAASLAARWREPSLTIHTIEISGPKSGFDGERWRLRD